MTGTNDGPRTRQAWIGGANLPTTGGSRLNLGMIFAELTLTEGVVELRVRGPMRQVFRPVTLRASPVDLVDVWPIRPRGWVASLFRFRGVGFLQSNQHEYYFKTFSIEDILGSLREAGFPVSEEARPAGKLWRGIP